MRRRLATAVLLLLLAGLQYRLWLADGGLLDNRRLEQSVQRQEDENAELQRRNSRLEAEVADLRQGGAAIEAHARTELGMIRKGETFYLVVEPSR
ncbi:MAG: cell division protein FtsB [Sinobacteraceae bacterium]|nr:cell division protein FtsB [Nevskia sp.]MDI3260987.1 cell division protein FtsB [Nevskiaceae bacterium]